ncbi:tubulin polyglutamylase TTLL11-like [Glandiceps talaboti]
MSSQRRRESKGRRRVRRPITVDTSKAQYVVGIALEELGSGWKEVRLRSEQKPCDIYWYHNGQVYARDSTITSGRVNVFPGMKNVLDKAAFSCILDSMRAIFPDEYDFYPRSWRVPEQFEEFMSETTAKQSRKGKRRNCYIFKPADASEGNGIFLLRNPQDIKAKLNISTRPAIVQEYITHPLLVEKKKFDLRIYVVITSLDPLKIYLYNEGMARFCTEDYHKPTDKNLHHIYMHLTNYSLNKKSGGYKHTEDITTGSKRTMSSVFETLHNNGSDVHKLREDIERVVCKTIIALTPQLKVHCNTEMMSGKSDVSYFQILGLDILITSDLKPYILEGNGSPSLCLEHESETAPGVTEMVSSPIDEIIKIPLVMETLKLVCPRPSSKYSSQKTATSQRTKTDEESETLSKLSLEDSSSTVTSSSLTSEDNFATPEANLDELYPAKYGEEYEDLRILERVSALFNYFIGTRGGLTMGASVFRKYTRVCKLCSVTFPTASADILFIEIANKWNGVGIGSSSGICFYGFVDIVSIIAGRKFPALGKVERLLKLLNLCEAKIERL